MLENTLIIIAALITGLILRKLRTRNLHLKHLHKFVDYPLPEAGVKTTYLVTKNGIIEIEEIGYDYKIVD